MTHARIALPVLMTLGLLACSSEGGAPAGTLTNASRAPASSQSPIDLPTTPANLAAFAAKITGTLRSRQRGCWEIEWDGSAFTVIFPHGTQRDSTDLEVLIIPGGRRIADGDVVEASGGVFEDASAVKLRRLIEISEVCLPATSSGFVILSEILRVE